MPNIRSRLRSLMSVLAVIGVISAGLAFNLDWPPSQAQGVPLSTAASLPAEPEEAPAGEMSAAFEKKGLAFFSLRDGIFSHLYAFNPLEVPYSFIQLTGNNWDDMHPSLSPDGQQLAYASRQNGYWDIYLLELATGKTTRLTDTPAYDGHPDWSPDGSQLVYESLVDGNLELMLLDLLLEAAEPMRLTYRPQDDSSPAWSPIDQRIAFLSTASSSTEVVVVDLAADMLAFRAIGLPLPGQKTNLSWAPDASLLAWSSDESGSPQIYTLDLSSGVVLPLAPGSSPAWDGSGEYLLTEMQAPNDYQLGVLRASVGQLFSSPLSLPGEITGVSWYRSANATVLSDTFEGIDSLLSDLQIETRPTTQGRNSFTRAELVALEGVTAPYPMLLDSVAGSFHQLRAAAASATGWDVFGSLEQAFRPISAPGNPSEQEDWLLTGRAFSANRQPVSAGWMVMRMERFNGQAYWRVFVKAAHQDGSQGMPITGLVWNLDARNSGLPAPFEQGGAWEKSPGGYWVDLTSLALQHGWLRLPALQNWRTYYHAARFNQWVQPGSLSWRSAIAELYPPEAIDRPTPIPTFDPAAVANAKPDQSLAPTPTFQPTWTPLAGEGNQH